MKTYHDFFNSWVDQTRPRWGRFLLGFLILSIALTDPYDVWGSLAVNTEFAAETEYSLTELPMINADTGNGPVEIDTNIGTHLPNDGSPMSIDGFPFEKGLGTHATSVISFDLEGLCSTFSATVGVDDAIVVGDGTVNFHVYGDGVHLYTSNHMVSGSPPRQTGDLDVSGVNELMLIVDDFNKRYYQDYANWADPVVTCSSKPAGDGSSFKHVRGEWGPVLDWPVKAIHASLLPSGHILSHASEDPTNIPEDFDGQQYGTTSVDLADISDWSHEWVNHLSEEMYCSAHTLLADGNVFEFGGHDGLNEDHFLYGRDQASVFDFQSKSWQLQQRMSQPRWYPTAVTLGNGDVMAIGGTHGYESENSFNPEIFNGTSWRTLTNVNYSDRLLTNVNLFNHTYPFVHLVSDGRVFWAGWDESMAYIDVEGNGAWGTNHTRENVRRAWGSPVMYEQDKLILIGGIGSHNIYDHANHSVQIVDLTGDQPVSRPTSEMLFPRADADAVILANGEVMINGGGYYHFLGFNPTHIRTPEIWNPDTEAWTLGAPATHPRGYHSTTLLLPDGRVWTAGGECGPDCLHGMTAQVYTPPYLFKQDGSGQLADRPTINSVDGPISYGQTFNANVSVSDDVSKVTFIRLGSSTHHINFEQRYQELPFTKDGDNLMITAPAHGNLAPPGFYMLFVFDDSGVPSVAEMVQILPADDLLWQPVVSADGSQPTERHEASYVEAGGNFYLMGGRGNRPVEKFDPAAKKWTNVGNPPLQFHHFQPVVFNDKIYVIGAFVGEYPNETPVEHVYIFDPADNSWTQGGQIPAGRRRGSTGAVVYGDKIYLVGGNTLGHNGGAQPWLDAYDPVANSWQTLTDAPHARDHFTAAVIGNQLFTAGGRQTDLPDPFDKTVAEVDVYNFMTGTWSIMIGDIPTERAGTMTVPHGKDLIVIGGESNAQNGAHREVEALDVNTGTWATLPPLITGRHSGGAVIWGNKIYAAAGSANRASGPELNSQESLLLSNPEPVLLTGDGSGLIVRERWENVAGHELSDLTSLATFPDEPDSRQTLSAFEVVTSNGDSYGQRLVGYVHPPASGMFQFAIASDDFGELWLSSDDDPANRIKIAEVAGFTGVREFSKYHEQTSQPILLEAGRKYYIEALHKEGTGEDHLSVAWQMTGGDQEVIDGRFLSPFIAVIATPQPTQTATPVPSGTPQPTPPLTQTPTQTPMPGSVRYIYLPSILR